MKLFFAAAITYVAIQSIRRNQQKRYQIQFNTFGVPVMVHCTQLIHQLPVFGLLALKCTEINVDYSFLAQNCFI